MDARLIHLRGGRPYDYTFSLPDAALVPSLRRDLEEFARGLLSWEVGDSVRLLTGLFHEDFNGETIRGCFSVVRDALAGFAGDGMAALYAPLSAVGPRIGEFRLHADLYRPEILLNVFDEVSGDQSGASLFLAGRSFRNMLHQTPELTSAARRDIEQCLALALNEDRYDYFFDLLHARRHPWTTSLGRSMRREQQYMRLTTGEGYLLHDRGWLHGRDAPTGGVSPRRLHRLVFGALVAPRGRS